MAVNWLQSNTIKELLDIKSTAQRVGSLSLFVECYQLDGFNGGCGCNDLTNATSKMAAMWMQLCCSFLWALNIQYVFIPIFNDYGRIYRG